LGCEQPGFLEQSASLVLLVPSVAWRIALLNELILVAHEFDTGREQIHRKHYRNNDATIP
jgi:hypothetical protein